MPHDSNLTDARGPRSGQIYSIIQGPEPKSCRFASPTRRRVPFAPYNPTQGRKAVTGRIHPIHSTVSFDYPGQARQEVSMQELRLEGTSTPIQGAGDPVLAHTGLHDLATDTSSSGVAQFLFSLPMAGPLRG
ncbi:hypothetical protein B0H17DRAFT_1338510 [Mycena rosella]|uniref:Uncharacterized protein n=1 Tax=Mycena rosella TaxID=1033263 RepID=A0AAD7FZY3_MYCRO|nr:hypothetical protein B0H17DRAFT_1338510 [Mycena rosella]